MVFLVKENKSHGTFIVLRFIVEINVNSFIEASPWLKLEIHCLLQLKFCSLIIRIITTNDFISSDISEFLVLVASGIQFLFPLRNWSPSKFYQYHHISLNTRELF